MTSSTCWYLAYPPDVHVNCARMCKWIAVFMSKRQRKFNINCDDYISSSWIMLLNTNDRRDTTNWKKTKKLWIIPQPLIKWIMMNFPKSVPPLHTRTYYHENQMHCWINPRIGVMCRLSGCDVMCMKTRINDVHGGDGIKQPEKSKMCWWRFWGICWMVLWFYELCSRMLATHHRRLLLRYRWM